MEEIKTTSKLLEIVEDNHAKYKALIDTIGSLSDNLSFVSGEQSITRLNKENSLASILPRLGVLADNSFPSLITDVSDKLFAEPSTIPRIGIDSQHPWKFAEPSTIPRIGIDSQHSWEFAKPSAISHFGIDSQHPWEFAKPSAISHFGIDSQHPWELAEPKEDSITAILGKFNYPSLLTKENDFLAITAKGYNFDNLQKVNYFLGDVATSAIQAVNGKFDNYSLVNVATKVTKDLISIDFKELNEIKDSSLGFYKKLKDKAQSLIDYFSDVFKNKGRYLPKNVEEFIEFWFDYNREILGFDFEKLFNYQIHENDLILFHYCVELKCEMRLDTINEAFDMVWKTVDKRNQKLLPSSPVTPVLENINNIGKKKRLKQPKAKTVIEFIRQIDNQLKITPKLSEYKDNDEKYAIIADKIKTFFGYHFSGGTLEKEDCKQQDKGYSLDVYNLLKEWKYNSIATKYNALHNK